MLAKPLIAGGPSISNSRACGSTFGRNSPILDGGGSGCLKHVMLT